MLYKARRWTQWYSNGVPDVNGEKELHQDIVKVCV